LTRVSRLALFMSPVFGSFPATLSTSSCIWVPVGFLRASRTVALYPAYAKITADIPGAQLICALPLTR
jgi:hypothetical protein